MKIDKVHRGGVIALVVVLLFVFLNWLGYLAAAVLTIDAGHTAFTAVNVLGVLVLGSLLRFVWRAIKDELQPWRNKLGRW